MLKGERPPHLTKNHTQSTRGTFQLYFAPNCPHSSTVASSSHRIIITSRNCCQYCGRFKWKKGRRQEGPSTAFQQQFVLSIRFCEPTTAPGTKLTCIQIGNPTAPASSGTAKTRTSISNPGGGGNKKSQPLEI